MKKSFILLKLIIAFLVICLTNMNQAAAQKPILILDSVSPATCECFQTWEKPMIRNYTPADFRTPYSTFTDFFSWKLADSNIFHEELFWTDMTFDVGYFGESFYSFTLVGYAPLRLEHPLKAFTVNLSPCNADKPYFELPVTMSYNNAMYNYDAAFDYKTFDHSIKSYFEVLMKLNQTNLYGVLKSILNQMTYTEDDNLTELDNYLKSLNKRFKTKFSIKGLSDEAFLDSVVSKLDAKGVDIETLILKDFVSGTESNRKASDNDFYMLDNIFRAVSGSDIKTEDLYKNVIHPTVRGGIYTSHHIGFELDTQIIRRWDTLAGKPAIDANGHYLPAAILADVKELQYSNLDGLEAEITGVYHLPIEISSTGWCLSFDTLLMVGEFCGKPFRIKSKVNDLTSAPINGILIPETGIVFTYQGKSVRAKGYDVFLTNNMIMIEVHIGLKDFNIIEPEKIQFGQGNDVVKTTVKEFTDYLVSVGLPFIEVSPPEVRSDANGNSFLRFTFYKFRD